MFWVESARDVQMPCPTRTRAPSNVARFERSVSTESLPEKFEDIPDVLFLDALLEVLDIQPLLPGYMEGCLGCSKR